MNICMLVFLWASISSHAVLADSAVDPSLQFSLETLESRQVLLEKNIEIIQQQELATLDLNIRTMFKQFENDETKGALEVDQDFIEKVADYTAILNLTQATAPVGLYNDQAVLRYDALFWIRYIPVCLDQAELQELKVEKLTFPLSSGYATLVKDFSQQYYAYKSFFEQWPVELQKNSLYYAKARDAYAAFTTTQAFVASLIAQQQALDTTEKQLKTLIAQFKTALYNHGSVALADKSQYENALGIYAAQGKTTSSQEYKQYQLWSFIASLLYYQDRAGLPQPTDATNAELFHTAYSGFSAFLDSFQKTWMYYADGQAALGAFMAYNDQCKALLEQPKVTPVPTQPVTPTPVQKPTATELLGDFISKNFTDEVIARADIATLALYNNLLEDYKNSTEYREADYQMYQLWADFVPVRQAQFKVIALSGVGDAKGPGVAVYFNSVFRVFMKTSSYAYLSKAYPSLLQELTLCSYYANWLGRQK